MHAVESYDITHRYGDITALHHMSFTIDRGELFGFIGPDGAGKTTLLRIAATLIIPTGGNMTISGLDTVKHYMELRNRTGYMPGRFSLYSDLTVEENLRFHASVFGTTIEKNYHLIEPVFRHLEPFRKRHAGHLSGGMKQKLALSCALIHKPEILILDEPTTGIDAVSRAELWVLLAWLKNEGVTIIVSTPYMDEALRCDRIALVQQGRLLGIDTPAGIRSSYHGKMWAIHHPDRYRLLIALRTLPQVISAEPFGEAVHITIREDSRPETVTQELAASGIHGVTINEILPGIEDVFLSLMKR